MPSAYPQSSLSEIKPLRHRSKNEAHPAQHAASHVTARSHRPNMTPRRVSSGPSRRPRHAGDSLEAEMEKLAMDCKMELRHGNGPKRAPVYGAPSSSPSDRLTRPMHRPRRSSLKVTQGDNGKTKNSASPPRVHWFSDDCDRPVDVEYGHDQVSAEFGRQWSKTELDLDQREPGMEPDDDTSSILDLYVDADANSRPNCPHTESRSSFHSRDEPMSSAESSQNPSPPFGPAPTPTDILDMQHELAQAHARLHELEPFSWIHIPASKFNAFMSDMDVTVPRALKAQKNLKEAMDKLKEYDDFIDIYEKNHKVLHRRLANCQHRIRKLEEDPVPAYIIQDKRTGPSFSTRFFQSLADHLTGSDRKAS
ncbi:hypothetical protein PUNSTDRAFT_141546 [Punctularia strigosozonata HHB-11173 SS5]|uniref:uncharacterized protein n=1 Tax=Punctularia strigosozonata (strain HHB-11173) TaxID=741275 RepID=UPI0004416BA4|nr:uncharacterized protein PUNSTDRAFT_141546 [Punctularia strigosozonata HHB-11173 SS5]EIN13019.1 hypothetical protein PUNSTDRAFT_141546 [Punctularia strigosozonata HHB-11173 SS5]